MRLYQAGESGCAGTVCAGKEEDETASIHRAEEARSRAQAGRASAGNAGTPARHFATAEKESRAGRAAACASAHREAQGSIRLGRIQVD